VQVRYDYVGCDVAQVEACLLVFGAGAGDDLAEDGGHGGWWAVVYIYVKYHQAEG
jgi:hypothetical protein